VVVADDAPEQGQDAGVKEDEDRDAPDDDADPNGVESSPSETTSVVAQAGGWIVSVAIIAQLVRTMDTVALAVRRKPSTESGGGTAVIETPAATTDHASRPAIPPMR